MARMSETRGKVGEMAKIGVDIRCDASGNLVVVTPLTANGRDWMASNVEAEDWQEYAGGLAVDLRYATDIVIAARAEDLSVSTAGFLV